MSSRKRPRPEPVEEDSSLGGLYDFLPPPDPEKDAAALAAAQKKPRSKPSLPPEDRTRVIFLDVDGVLLPAGSVETIFIDGIALPVRETMKETDFSTGALENLRAIVMQTGATIVLSSEWRRSDSLTSSIAAVMKSYELPVIRDLTPILTPRPELQKYDSAIVWCERRAREIGKWLKEHKEVTAWVAIDDLDFSWADSVRIVGTPYCKHRSVHTDPSKCILDSDAAEAVRILTNPPPEPKVVVRRSFDASTEGAGGPICSTEDSGPERIRLG